MRLSTFSLAMLLAVAAPIAAQAASTTKAGQISVAQVVEMATLAGSSPEARMTIIAYLAGIGEATGIMVSEGQKRGATPVRCSNAFTLDENTALAAVTTAAPDRATWTETAATPIIIADLFSRAGCS